ncbi:hypothetical protein [uncultured Methylobacterium sp.]|uniref:hypothetical protein n=1 Tax=uncultured Methylobacterium sp. TaxID=157278 RepID=UPI0035CBAC1F
MRQVLAGLVGLAFLTGAASAQSYSAPAGSDVPGSGLNGLSKADRKKVCTMSADDRHMKGISRQQYRAACRGRPIPRG